MSAPPVVYVIDDDAEMRGAISRLVEAAGLETRHCASLNELLAGYDRERPGCILLDVRHPAVASSGSALAALLERSRQDTAPRDLKATVAMRALDRLAAGIIVTDAQGRVLQMNRAAERIVTVDDGLGIRKGHLVAHRVFETTRLAKLTEAACSGSSSKVLAGRMLERRRNGGEPYVVIVALLGVEPVDEHGPLAIVLADDPDEHAPSRKDLVEFFGLSPAESRLAEALMRGKKLREIAADSGVQVTTLRTQLSSILKKVGVDGQANLVRVLASIRFVRSDTD
jgi:FixJ family two-component response regulator